MPNPTPLEQHPLAVCFRLCQSLDRAGEIIWSTYKLWEERMIADAEKDAERSKTVLSNERRREIREKRIEHIRYALGWLRDKAKEGLYTVPPFDFITFVESPQLLAKPGALWPRVLEEGREINSGKYTETVLTGGIGVAKSTLALYTQAYQVYVLSCMRDPHKVFDLDAASEILIVFQSINKNLAVDVDYRRFRSMLNDSPYFQTVFTYRKDRDSDIRFHKFNIVVKPVAGGDAAAIGQNVIGGILDELNFMQVIESSKKSKDGGLHDQAIKNYNSIARRRESRFMQMGSLPGMLCLVSSRNYPGQFTDKKEAEAREQKRRLGFSTIYVYDKCLWEIRPERYMFHTGQRNEERYGPDHPFWFNVFVGDDTRKPRIMEAGEEVAVEDRRLVKPIPIEHLQAFENDLLPALRDIAGVATQALHPFMLNTEAVTNCFGRVLSIVSRDDCDFAQTRLQVYPKRIEHPKEFRFAHVDLAISKDSAGVCVGHVPGFVDIQRGESVETLPIVQFDMILEVRPPRGGEIEFENIRKLLYLLRDKLHLPLRWVTFDNFQSKDSMQIMHQQGFTTGYQSMDIDTYAYDVSKQAFYDDRVRAPAHPKAMREMITLEIDPKKNKIDHPPNGSKDVSDAMAGVIFGLTMRREVWVRHGIPTHRLPPSLSNVKAQQTKNSLSTAEAIRVSSHA